MQKLTIILKSLVFTIFFLFVSFTIFAQQDSATKKADTTIVVKPVVKPLPKKIILPDTITKPNPIDTPKQQKDSVALADSLKKDSIQKEVLNTKAKPPKNDTGTYASIMYHQYIPWDKEQLFMVTQLKTDNSNDYLFYALTSIFFVFAFIKMVFPKYINNIFKLFFQTSFRQKQTREQISQDNLASLLMNILFVLSGGMFIALFTKQQNWVALNFWWLLIYSCCVLASIYITKYFFLLFAGWVFNAKEAADTYLFIVFLVNKIFGVVLLPLLLLLSFSSTTIIQVTSTITLIIVLILLIYRYVVSLGTIRSNLKVNALHFFLYLCTVEVLPLLLMYKVFFNFVKEQH